MPDAPGYRSNRRGDCLSDEYGEGVGLVLVIGVFLIVFVVFLLTAQPVTTAERVNDLRAAQGELYTFTASECAERDVHFDSFCINERKLTNIRCPDEIIFKGGFELPSCYWLERMNGYEDRVPEELIMECPAFLEPELYPGSSLCFWSLEDEIDDPVCLEWDFSYRDGDCRLYCHTRGDNDAWFCATSDDVEKWGEAV